MELNYQKKAMLKLYKYLEGTYAKTNLEPIHLKSISNLAHGSEKIYVLVYNQRETANHENNELQKEDFKAIFKIGQRLKPDFLFSE